MTGVERTRTLAAKPQTCGCVLVSEQIGGSSFVRERWESFCAQHARDNAVHEAEYQRHERAKKLREELA